MEKPEDQAKVALRRELQAMPFFRLEDLARSGELNLEDAARQVSPPYAAAADLVAAATKAAEDNAKSIKHYQKAFDGAVDEGDRI